MTNNNPFEAFAMATTFSQIMATFNDMCIDLNISSTDHRNFYATYENFLLNCLKSVLLVVINCISLD